MCGVAGLWDRSADRREDVDARLAAMTAAIRHRGPDGEGAWSDLAAGIGLGHLRLAIQDLSPLGAQPMASTSGRFVLTYNGEIYNVAELRADLAAAGCTFRGTSDTEVFLAGVERWGLRATLAHTAGMFAMGLWDREERSLTLVRDRLGKKPLHVGEAGGTLLFGSELKALMAHPGLARRIDRGALASYLRFGHVPGTAGILHGVRKVAPGTLERHGADGRVTVETYWDLAAVAARGQARPATGDRVVLADAAEAEIDRAVRERLVSDVPVGAFLSGGIDSSLVVALMQRHAPGGARTFSIGFDDPRYDEAPYAARIAAHLGTRHTTLPVTAADALAVIPALPTMFDEPFADSSQIPTHLVARLARGEVTVALSGDGGDEIAGGYRRHAMIAHWWPRLAMVPLPLRRLLAGTLQALPPGAIEALAGLLPGGGRPGNRPEQLRKAASILGQRDARGVYARLVTLWSEAEAIVASPALPSPIDDAAEGAGLTLLGLLRLLDMATYLPDDILTKVDRASMAEALEARCPLLDHRVVEHFWTLPDAALVQGTTGKVILRDILARHVPPALFERPKTGFGIPLGDWLRGPLRAWALDLVEGERADAPEALDWGRLVPAVQAHMDGRADHAHRVWALLMLLAWRRQWGAAWS
ncbi:asparagine synthase (glutamine-hydrolyzing) [uncultured Alsobacter sp.]|uniref:asparagine synthase (glutamine-hydrolyzing) n=1 Tax=uncultured Alsobacter sp. TaxID=1748258 RepID=UPI0025F14FB3|nr:asparagine synthase (glutamine-hydrolyzing) [uncultured Alsobacter sp.]